MSDKRIIIKNCPARLVFGHVNYCQEFKFLCADCTDCVMKQIVELCAEEYYKCKHCKKECNDKCSQASGFDLTLKIRQLLDIDEVE